MLVAENMSKEEMVKEAVEEAKAKAAKETGEQEEQAEETVEETAEQEEVSEEAEEASEEEETEEGSGFMKKFGRKNKKDKKDEKIEELTDRLTRQMAEFDNFRKRTEKEKAQMFDMGARTIIEKILPVIDNFERGLAAVPEEQKDDAFVTGMDKVYKQMLTELDAIGVKPIEALGKEFDPDLHNAVMQVESEEYEPGTVAQELQKGYTYKDNVVRHSMVAVVSE